VRSRPVTHDRVIEGAGAVAGAKSRAPLRLAIIRSRFNEVVTQRLLDGAWETLRASGVREDAIDVAVVPGAFEIPLVASCLARSRRYDALICLGAVIRGATPHFDYICEVVSQGIARVAYDYELPVIFGVLTTNTEKQAEARSGKAGKAGVNRGSEAAVTALEMVQVMRKLRTRPGRPAPTRSR